MDMQTMQLSQTDCVLAMRKTLVGSLGQENPLEKEMATHSSILAWRIPGSESQTQLKQLSSSSRVDLQYCLFLVFMKSYKVNILMPTLQMLNQRCREVTSLAQGHIQ